MNKREIRCVYFSHFAVELCNNWLLPLQVAARYSHFKIPLDEAEWIGLTLNEACAKLQDMYEMSGPLKYHYERECVTQEIESDETANK
jgi:hypothetical protein